MRTGYTDIKSKIAELIETKESGGYSRGEGEGLGGMEIGEMLVKGYKLQETMKIKRVNKKWIIHLIHLALSILFRYYVKYSITKPKKNILCTNM